MGVSEEVKASPGDVVVLAKYSGTASLCDAADFPVGESLESKWRLSCASCENRLRRPKRRRRGQRAPAGYGRVSGERTEAVVEEGVRKMSEKALGMLKHMRRQIFGHPAPYVEVRGAAVSIGVNPGGSECDDLVDELLQAGYIRTYPSPSLTAHGLYRLTDRGIAAAQEG